MKKVIKFVVYTIITIGLMLAVLLNIGCIMSDCISGPSPWEEIR